MVVLVLGPGGTDHDACAVLGALQHDVRAMPLAGTASVPEVVLQGGDIDAVVLDLAQRLEALKFLRRRARDGRTVPVIGIAPARGTETATDALRLGAIDILTRPLRQADMTAALDNAREFASQPRDRGELEAETTAEGVFGPSRGMRAALDLARRAAQARCAVLIVGERGTGRGMVARVIHAASAGCAEPFVRVHCPALNGGAESLDQANLPAAGTLFLEDIGDLPQPAQALVTLLMRGLLPSHRNGLRVIAAAQPRIWDAVARGTVSRDFVEALSVVRIDLEPLRQRPEDIPLIALRFLKEACTRHGAAPKTFSRSALSLLSAMTWPGNAGQLRSLCDRLAVLVGRGVVLLEDVLAHVKLEAAVPITGPREPLRDARDRFERDYIVSTLQEHRGRIGAAAEQLGIERTNLYRKMKQLKIRVTSLDA
jgi:DNA-binding NtrC family response regulator